MTTWPLVPLGEVITHRKEFIQIDDSSVYKRCRVQLHAQGVVLRDEVPGIEIKTKAQQVCRAGEFLVAEIDAKVGGFGIVPPNLEGAIVSSHYFLFTVNHHLLDAEFVGYYSKTAAFRDQVTAQGSTNYAAIRPSHVLTYTMPLPPVEEQRRIVRRIDQLTGLVRETRLLQTESRKAVLALTGSIAGEAMADAIGRHGERSLGSFEPVVTSGPRNWAEKCGQGAIRFYRAQDLGPDGRISHKSKAYISPPANGQAKAAKLMPGDVMLVITGTTVGRCAVFSGSDEPGYVNQHVALCRLPHAEVNPDFVRWALLSPQGQDQLLGKRYGQGKPGLNLNNIRQLTIPSAPLTEQRRIAERLDSTAQQMGGLRSAHGAVSEELESLLPSVLNRAFNRDL